MADPVQPATYVGMARLGVIAAKVITGRPCTGARCNYREPPPATR
ncbi:hypothetical protein I552_0017 [Mycobacterium xenopi 3993]|nr:hypothetical protein I552_0017 [Mycobacterium xenopi 3993]